MILESTDPATGERLGEVEVTDPARLHATVSAAHATFDGDWRRDPVLRAGALLAWADAIQAAAGELSDLLMRETGKVRAETELEIALSVDALRFNAGIARHVDGAAGTMRDGSVSHLVREPIGVAAFIVPWNWPVFLLLRDLAPGLAAGVTAVVKPAPQTPLSTRWALELGHAAGVPADAVYGGADVGRALVEHPAVRAVSFTGSTAVGREVMRAAANDFTRVLLELGGKGASLIFADADLDAAVATCVAAGFITSGQMCMANTRILAERPVYELVRSAVCERVAGLRAGPPQDPGSDLGPLISAQQVERVVGYLDLARDRLVVGGERLDRSYLAPAVLAGADLPDPIVREEIFGPVVTVEPFATEEEGIRLANATPYGLAASVWTNDARRAWRAAGAIEAGTVWINRYNRMFPEIPSGGVKQSGVGRTRGLAGVHEFTELKHINWDL